MTNNNIDTIDRLARIETIVTRLETRLLGNGQPGELALMTTRIDGIDKRLDVVERTESKARGAFWVISAVITFLTSGGLIHIFKSR